MIRLFLIHLLFVFCFQNVYAMDLRSLNKVVLFPVQVSTNKKIDELDVWWKMRSQLARSQRFVVVTYDFLKKKDVFQPRGALISTDVILLGRLLAADLIMTFSVEQYIFTTNVYDTFSGLQLWTRSIRLNPAFVLQPQVERAATSHLRFFEKDLPFTGHVKVSGRNVELLNVSEGLHVGDGVEIFKITLTGGTPVFPNEYKKNVVARAQVEKRSGSQRQLKIVEGAVSGPAEVLFAKSIKSVKKKEPQIKPSQVTEADVVESQKKYLWFSVIGVILLGLFF